MPLFNRTDGTLATDVAPFRRMMQFIMPTRTESAVYYEQELDLTLTQEFIDRYNAAHSRPITVFHVLLWATTRALHERPRMNRFVVGKRVYQRDGVWISYSAKKKLADGSPIVVLKRRFDPAWSFQQLVQFIHGDVKVGRSDQLTHMDKEFNVLLKLPGLLLSLGLMIVKLLDALNLLPESFVRNDTMYASLFVANLGSVKLESAFHHLFEYGNCPLFAAIGQTKRVIAVDERGKVTTRLVCSVKYTFDERIEDGLYCAQSLDLVRTMVEDPTAFGASAAAEPVAVEAEAPVAEPAGQPVERPSPAAA